MKFIIDMNLSPLWVQVLESQGWEAVHWSTIGAIDARDDEIMAWAKEHGTIVFTHDLDFGTILAATRANAPSVIQVRTQDVSPDALQDTLFAAIQQHQTLLESGALIIVDKHRLRARILPLD